MKKCVVFYAIAVIVVALFFAFQVLRSDVADVLTAKGWLFYLTSCVSHAACLCIVPLLGCVLPTCFGKDRIGRWIGGVLLTVLMYFIWLDSNVFAIYRFHINGFVMNMVLGPGAGDIFAFSPMVYAKELIAVLLMALLVWGAWKAADWVVDKNNKCYGLPLVLTILLCTLVAHGLHVVGSYQRDFSVVSSARLLPQFYPLTAKKLCRKLGVKEGEGRELKTGSVVGYPLKPLAFAPDSAKGKLPNIVVILMDSWNKRTFNAENMPNVWKFSEENAVFDNHFSASNGTRSAVFSFFFGLSCYYWEDFEAASLRPLLVHSLLEKGYDCRVFPSANLLNPDFAGVLFPEIPNLTVSTEGLTAYERDVRLTDKFLTELPLLQNGSKPYFAFLFYDLPHSYWVPAEKNTHYTPAWEFADFASLNNEADPTPFFNLYRNCCFEDDIMIGRVLDSLKSTGVLENTIVILSGDHAQEFNENHRNYWGHNSNFSQWQLAVPMIVHWPKGLKNQMPKGNYRHRTTHYDIVPTLMRELGVQNPPSDYSMGEFLTDSIDRGDELVGSHLNFAFIGKGDTIFEQLPGGGFQVYGPDMTPLRSYHVSTQQFEKWMNKLNTFYK